jgi:hypothetical protein
MEINIFLFWVQMLPILCQRSRCLLKMESHYLAMEDAKKAIQLDSELLLGKNVFKKYVYILFSMNDLS